MYLDDELVSGTRVERLNSLFSQAGYDLQNREVIIKVTNFHARRWMPRWNWRGREPSTELADTC